MGKTVQLRVKDGKVTAREGLLGGDGGHFTANPAETVKWKGNYEGGDFVVSFRDVNDGLKPGWPFAGAAPPGMQLVVEGDGNPRPNLTLKASEALWKYDVAVSSGTGVAPLDPMLIIRDTSIFDEVMLTALIAFGLGVLAAALALRATRSRSG